MPFYQLLILSANEYSELCVDRTVCMSLDEAYRIGNLCAEGQDVYGYIIAENRNGNLRIVSESVYGIDYVIFDHKKDGIIIREGVMA